MNDNIFKLSKIIFYKLLILDYSLTVNLSLGNNTTDTNSTIIESNCEMFGAFSYIIQFILGVLSFMILICK
jgi:hypothetical protein